MSDIILSPDQEPDRFVRNALKLAATRKGLHDWQRRYNRAVRLNLSTELRAMYAHELQWARFKHNQAEYAVLFPQFA